MSETIETILDGVIKAEGGYVDHPADRGGPTNYGITESVARASGWTGPIKGITEEFARGVYREQYVRRPGFDSIATMSAAVGAELVDTGVNMGPGTAGAILQRALNLLNRGGSTYADIPVDGQCGPQTRGALRAFLDSRPHAERILLKLMNILQGHRYVEIAERDESQEDFVAGWMKRIEIH